MQSAHALAPEPHGGRQKAINGLEHQRPVAERHAEGAQRPIVDSHNVPERDGGAYVWNVRQGRKVSWYSFARSQPCRHSASARCNVHHPARLLLQAWRWVYSTARRPQPPLPRLQLLVNLRSDHALSRGRGRDHERPWRGLRAHPRRCSLRVGCGGTAPQRRLE